MLFILMKFIGTYIFLFSNFTSEVTSILKIKIDLKLLNNIINKHYYY